MTGGRVESPRNEGAGKNTIPGDHDAMRIR